MRAREPQLALPCLALAAVARFACRVAQYPFGRVPIMSASGAQCSSPSHYSSQPSSTLSLSSAAPAAAAAVAEAAAAAEEQQQQQLKNTFSQ